MNIPVRIKSRPCSRLTLATPFWCLSLRRYLIAGLDQVCDCSAELRVGDWAVDVARKFPSAQVIGMDKSSVQKKHKPDNCKFMVGDINTDLAQFADGTFDLVHSRLTPSSVEVMVGWS